MRRSCVTHDNRAEGLGLASGSNAASWWLGPQPLPQVEQGTYVMVLPVSTITANFLAGDPAHSSGGSVSRCCDCSSRLQWQLLQSPHTIRPPTKVNIRVEVSEIFDGAGKLHSSVPQEQTARRAKRAAGRQRKRVLCAGMPPA